jgi:hypothetical protein
MSSEIIINVATSYKTFWRFVYLRVIAGKPTRILYFWGWKRLYKMEWG